MPKRAREGEDEEDDRRVRKRRESIARLVVNCFDGNADTRPVVVPSDSQRTNYSVIIPSAFRVTAKQLDRLAKIPVVGAISVEYGVQGADMMVTACVYPTPRDVVREQPFVAMEPRVYHATVPEPVYNEAAHVSQYVRLSPKEEPSFQFEKDTDTYRITFPVVEHIKWTALQYLFNRYNDLTISLGKKTLLLHFSISSAAAAV